MADPPFGRWAAAARVHTLFVRCPRPRLHPIRAAEREAEHLRELANEGESAATPLILIATWIVVAAFLVTLAVTLALLASSAFTR